MFSWTFSWLDVLLLVGAIVGLIYYFTTKTFGFFDKHGVKYIKPYPLIGNMLPLVLAKEHMNYIIENIYNTFKDDKVCGFYNFTIPSLILKDLDLIKRITVKDFDHFTDHFPVPIETDPLFFHNLFSLRGEKWHSMRSILSPAFTGSKMKEMMPLVDECTDHFIQYLKKESDSPAIRNGKGYMEMEVKELVSKLTNDVIASCAFGLQSDSFKDPDNKFNKMSKTVINIELKDLLKFIPVAIFPVLAKFVKVTLMKEEVANYYRFLVMDIIKQRKESGVIRRDMIHLLMQVMQGSLHEENAAENLDEDNVGFATVAEDLKGMNSGKRVWKDDEITAQAVIFLFAGYETISTALSFMCYELALNPHVQAKLREEVDQYIAETGGMLKYNHIRSLTYMDMVLSETLRMWPPVGTLDRCCVKDYTLPIKVNNQTYVVKKGDMVMIPVRAIQRDEQYYPNPDKFTPERFSEENKGSINPESFLPFGIGPRSCIGNRFALMETKIIMFHLLANFEVVQTARTEIPIKIKSHTFNQHAVNGIWLGLKRRSN